MAMVYQRGSIGCLDGWLAKPKSVTCPIGEEEERGRLSWTLSEAGHPSDCPPQLLYFSRYLWHKVQEAAGT